MAENEEIVELPAVLREKSSDEFESIKQQALKLSAKDSTVNAILTTLITAPRINAVARLALTRELAKEGLAWQDGVEEFLLQAASARAAQPCSRAEVLQFVMGTVVPLLQEEVERELEEHRAQSLMAAAEIRKRLAATPIEVQTGHTDTVQIKRDSVLVAVGREDDIALLMNLLPRPAMRTWGAETEDSIQHVSVLRLDTKTKRQKLKSANDKRQDMVVVGSNKWIGVANSSNKMATQFQEWAIELTHNRCDLVLVCDALLLFTGGLTTRLPAYVAADGLKRLKDVASSQNFAAVAGLRADTPEEIEKFKSVLGDHFTFIDCTGLSEEE